MTFCVTRVSTCCTHTLGWAGCRCRPCCRVGIVATRLLEHSSCLGTFPTSLPSVPTTLLEGAGAVLDWGPGARLGCVSPSCSVAHLCFLWWAHPVRAVPCAAGLTPMLFATRGELFCVLLITWKVPGHGLPLGLPEQEPGSPSAVSTALSHLGTGQEGSVLVVR